MREVHRHPAIAAALATGLVLLNGCGIFESEKDNLPIDGKVVFSISEGWLDNQAEGPPDIFLTMKTEKIYPCSNYRIVARILIEAGSVNIGLWHIYRPEACLETEGPARFEDRLLLDTATYQLSFNHDDKYLLIVTDSSVRLQGQPGRLTTPEETLNWRFVPKSFALLCGATGELGWMCEDLADSVRTLPSLREFSFPDSGRIPYRKRNLGHHYQAPARYFLYNTEADYDSVGALLEDYTRQIIADRQGVSIYLTNWRNKQFYSWGFDK